MEDESSPTSKEPGIKELARDVAILWVLTLIGGFFVGFFGRLGAWSAGGTQMAIALSNFVLGTIGFTISGCLVGGQRWKHLRNVMLCVWVTGLINLLVGVTLIQWALSLIVLTIIMLTGGGISHLLRRD